MSGDPALVAVEGAGWEARGRRILGPVDLEIRRGERVVVIGPNGAGKTTLLRLLAGVLAPSLGTVRWHGQDASQVDRRTRARHVAYVPQVGPGRVPLTVEQLVLQGRYPHLQGLRLAPGREDFAAVERALETVGIVDKRSFALDELSGGERQAAFIAAALAQEGELLVLDEPTTHLDPRHQWEVAELVGRLAREGGRTVVAATHDLAVAAAMADRVIGLREGQVLADAPAKEWLVPARLEELFGAPFRIVELQMGPVPVLELPR